MKSTSPAYSVSSSAYDQRLGQFLSADPFVQNPTNTQNYNRYAYCLNNPLKYTDPSGYRISGNNNYWGQNGSNADPVTYSVDNVTVSRTEYILNGGDRVAVFHGNIGWQGSDGGYCMLDFYYSASASTVNFSYQVGTATVSNTDSYYGNTTKSQEPVYDYRSYSFSFSQSRQSSASGNGYVLGALCASYSTYKVFDQAISGGVKNVDGWDAADAVVGWAGTISVVVLAVGTTSNPVGWAVIGAGATIYGVFRAGQYIYNNY